MISAIVNNPISPQTSSAPRDATIGARRYCLITPCRDEEKFARRTLDSIAEQTIPPALWVIVDDGSRDGTPEILREFAQKLPYIRIIRRPDRGDRKLGSGVIEAFDSGYETIDPRQFDYVCKLDLDLDLPAAYFEQLIARMEQNPRIGTCSGKPYMELDGKLISEKCGDENSVGMIKFYRTACFRQIGGFVREVMWDGIDCHRCRMHRWIAVSWDDPQLRFTHLRPMGTSPAYMLASALFRMTRPPIVIGGIAMMWGYLRGWMRGSPQYADKEFRRFLRRYQWSCLLRGKARATALLNHSQSGKWKPDVDGITPPHATTS